MHSEDQALKNFLFKYFGAQIIINAHPSRFTFDRPSRNFHISVEPYIYLAKEESKWQPTAIGEEIPAEYRSDPNICRVDLFDLNQQRTASIPLPMDDLIELFFEYGIGRCFEMSLLPQVRPVVFILGVDRFKDYYKNPKEMFEKSAKLAGAGIVIFDETEL